MGFALRGFADVGFYLGLISLCLGCFVCLSWFWFTAILLLDLVFLARLLLVLGSLYFALFVVYVAYGDLWVWFRVLPVEFWFWV